MARNKWHSALANHAHIDFLGAAGPANRARIDIFGINKEGQAPARGERPARRANAKMPQGFR